MVHQGGSRSGKTYSICQWLVEMAYLNRNSSPSVVTVARKTLPATKATVLRDFMDIIVKEGMYREDNHNKTECTYKLFNTLFEFVGVDQQQKVRGRKRNLLYLNEANEFSFADFTQLIMRTTDRVILDYNPSDEFHWIYDNVLTREDCDFYQTTYKDNPFLSAATINEIEHLKNVDENFWRVFGLGERGSSRATIYTHWQQTPMMPTSGTDLYGIDFGFNNPTAVAHLRIYDNAIYAEELLYRSNITNSELIGLLPSMIPNRQSVIFADAAEPQRIEEIHRAGYNIKPADKSVKDGIDRIRRTPLYILNSSVNMIKEIKSYKYQEDKDGKVLEEPVKLNDHLLDAMRYAWHTYHMKPSGNYAIR